LGYQKNEYNLNNTFYDPWANPAIVKIEYDSDVINELQKEKLDTAIVAVAYKKFEAMDVPTL